MPLTPGTRLGPYEILEPVGKGGMGEVYKARDPRLGRDVAIKVSAEHFSERFEREARAIAALNHPNICQIYDVCTSSDAPNYLVMELIDGAPLKCPMPLDQALKYAAQICDALDAAHKKGITHRDLKPANILVTKAGIKLLDFGLAKLSRDSNGAGIVSPANVAGSPENSPTLTMALTGKNEIVGTLFYMSPEQLQAQANGQEIDARSDIFSFGLVLHEMLTGKRAFAGASPASVIAAIMERPAPSIAAIAPPALDRLLQRCLAKDPDERWQSARDLKAELEWIANASDETQAIPARSHSRLGLHPAKLAWIAAGVLAVALAGVSFMAYRATRPAEQLAARVSILPPPNAAIVPDSAPAISPDGSKIAFTAKDSSGKTMLWIRPIDSLTAQPLAGTEGGRHPFWSPDGRFVAFFAEDKIKKADVAGGPPQTIAGDLDLVGGLPSGAWSSQGMIIYSRQTIEPLFAVPAGGGDPKPLTRLDRARQDRFHGYPHFLPDGRHFLFLVMSAKPENSGVYVGSLDSPETKRVLSVASEAQYAPSGHLLYVRDGTLMAQRFDAARLEVSGEAFPVAEHVAADSIFGAAIFTVSGNGALIFRNGQGGGNTQLQWFDRTGKPLTVAGPPGDYLNPELSPDGTKVAFQRRNVQRDFDIWLLDLARGTSSRLTFGHSDETMPVWSPDGSRIVFASRRDGAFGLYQKLTNGTGNEELLFQTAADVIPIRWSPDGGSIILRSANAKGQAEVWILPLTGDPKPFPLLHSEEFNFSVPQPSPDGRWLAYYSFESGRQEVYIQSFPKVGSKWQVSTGGGVNHRWSRDGKEIFFLGADGSLMAAMLKGGSTPETGAPRRLFEARTFSGSQTVFGFKQQYDVASDGRFLMNVPAAEDAAAPLTLVLNWAAGLKK